MVVEKVSHATKPARLFETAANGRQIGHPVSRQEVAACRGVIEERDPAMPLSYPLESWPRIYPGL